MWKVEGGGVLMDVRTRRHNILRGPTAASVMGIWNCGADTALASRAIEPPRQPGVHLPADRQADVPAASLRPLSSTSASCWAARAAVTRALPVGEGTVRAVKPLRQLNCACGRRRRRGSGRWVAREDAARSARVAELTEDLLLFCNSTGWIASGAFLNGAATSSGERRMKPLPWW